MKAKKLLMLVLDLIIVAIVAVSLMAKTTEKKVALTNGQTLLAENEELSFDLIPDPEEKYVKAGETVEIVLSVKDINIGEEGLNSIVGYLGYDENVFDSMTIEGVGEESDPNKWNIELNQIKTHDMYGKFCIYTMQEGVTEDQAVVKMVVKLKDDLKPQRTEITFTSLASSDGEVEVPEEDRKVVLIIVEDEPIVPDEPETPEEPEKVEPKKEVKTGDNVIFMFGTLIVATLTIMLNVLVFSKGKNKKILGMFTVLFVGLTCAGIVSKAAIDVNAFRREYGFEQNWLNSNKYLVTDEIVSRIEPEKNVTEIADKYNKAVVVKKDGETVSEGFVGTGMKMYLASQTKVDAESDFSDAYEYEVSVWGDTNGDGKSNQVELTRIIRNIMDDTKWALSGAKFTSADMKIDNAIDEEDRDASVMYIVYGDQEIAGFDQVVEPKLEVVEGTFDQDLGCYTTDVKVRITEQDMNGTKTKYKVENSEGRQVPFTEINRIELDGQITDEITLPAGEIYKVSAYTYGKDGNRSEIPYLIVDGVRFNITYTNTKDATVVDNKTNPTVYTTGITPFDINNLNNVTGYEFIGWTLEKVDGQAQTPGEPSKSTQVAQGQKGDLEYKANWKVIDYDITYILDGGDNHPDNPDTHNIEDPDIPLGVPTRPGNTFHEWVQTPDPGTGHPNIIPGGTVGEITLTAVWEYNITYKDTRNASIVDNHTNPSTYLTADTPFEIYNLNDIPGAEFKGWTLTKIGNETQTPGTPSMSMSVAQGQKENLEFTANWEEVVQNTYDVTGEVIGGNGSIEGVPQNDIPEGGDTEDDIILTADEGEVSGYTLNTLRLYSGSEIDGTYSATDTDGIDYKNNVIRYRENGHTKYLVDPIEDIHANKHLVATFKAADVVAQIVAMPDASLDDYAPNGYKIKGHKYETLEDAIADAQKTNDKREQDGLPRGGTVEILILKDIDGEVNSIEAKNDVTINLDSHTISLEDDDLNAITVQNDGRLTILDRSNDQEGKVVNHTGTPIRIREGGELTLGINNNILDEMPSKTCPTIEGNVCIQIDEDGDDHGQFNFYDGQLVTPQAPIYTGHITDIRTPDSCAVTTEEIRNDQDEVVGVRAVLQVLSGYEAIIENNGMRYSTLEEAFYAVNTNDAFDMDHPATIRIISDHPVELESSCIVNRDKNVILDVAGRTVKPAEELPTNTALFHAFRGKLEIIDRTAVPDSSRQYSQVVNDDNDYYFVTGPGYLQPNNIDKPGTTAKSHIKIDLTGPEYDPNETYEVEMDFYKSFTSEGYGLRAKITESEEHPELANSTAGLFGYGPGGHANTAEYNHIYKQNLQGGKVYYLHMDYKTEARADLGLSAPMRIYKLTVDGNDILSDVICPKGTLIVNRQQYIMTASNDAEIIINNVYVDLNGGYSVTSQNVQMTQGARPKYTVKKGVIIGNMDGNFGTQDVSLEGGTVVGSLTSTGMNHNYVYATDVDISGTAMVHEIYAHHIDVNGGWVARANQAQTSTDDTITMEDGYVFYMNAKNITTTGGYINNLYEDVLDSVVSSKDTEIYYVYDHATNGVITLDNCTTIAINIGGSTLNFKDSTAKSISAGNDATLNIISGEVNNPSGTAINIPSQNVVVTLGSKNVESGDTMTTSTPIIKGKNGIVGPNGSGTTVKFYDGKVIAEAGKGLVNATVSEVEYDSEAGTDYEIINGTYSEDETLKTWYLGHSIEAVARIRVNAPGVDVSGISPSLYEDDGEYYYFTAFDAAISACGANSTQNPTKIELLEDVDISSEVVIDSGKNVELDLNGKSFKSSKLTNNGTFTLSDTATGGSTNITTGTVNNGTFTFNNAGTNSTAITNNGNMNINDGTYDMKLTGTDGSTLTVTAGKFNYGSSVNNYSIESSGDVTFNELVANTLSVNRAKVTKGNLTVNGGYFYNNLDYTSTEANTKATITDATIYNSRTGYGTLTIGQGAVAEITNSRIATVHNTGDLTLKGTADSLNHFGGLTNNNHGTVIVEGGQLEAGISNNAGATFEVKESCTSCRLTGVQQQGHMILGENNGTIDRDKIVITSSNSLTKAISNSGTIDFYDGKVIEYIIPSQGGIINTPAGYEVLTKEEDGQTITSIYPCEYVVEVPAGSVNASVIQSQNIPCTQDGGNYYFYDLAGAAAAINDNVETTVRYVADKIYYTAKDQDVIGANKKIILDLNGHRVVYACFAATDYAIENNGTLTIKDSTNGDGEIVTNCHVIDNKGTFTLQNGKYGRTTTVYLDSATEGPYVVVKNTGTATIKSDAQILVNSSNTSVISVMNNDDGYMVFEMNNPNGKVVNNTTEGNANAGMKISGNLTSKITNTSGNMWVENTTDTDGAIAGEGDVYVNNATLTQIECKNATIENATVSSRINFKNNLLFKDSSVDTITAGAGSNPDAVARIESGTVRTVQVIGGTVYLGKDTDAYSATNVQIKGTGNQEYDSSISTGTLYYYSGTVNEIYHKPARPSSSGTFDPYDKTTGLNRVNNVIIPANADIEREYNADDNTKYTIKLVAKQNEARYNGTDYPTLKAAVEAAQGSTNGVVELLKDVYITEGRQVANAGTITLKLNDHSIFINATNQFTNTGTLNIQLGNGNIGIIDSTGTINITSGAQTDDNELNSISTRENSVVNVNNADTKLDIKAFNSQVHVDSATVKKIQTYNEGGEHEHNEVTILNNSKVTNDVYLTGSAMNIQDSEINTLSASNAGGEVEQMRSIKNCTISKATVGGADEEYPIVLENCTIENAGTPVLVNGSGTILKNCTITHTGTNGYGVEIRSGSKATIIGGTVTSQNTAVYVPAGYTPGTIFDQSVYVTKLTLGVDDNNVDGTAPVIDGAKYGMYKGSKWCNISFYDGVIKGGTKAIQNDAGVDNVPRMYRTWKFAKGEEGGEADREVIRLALKGTYTPVLRVGDQTYKNGTSLIYSAFQEAISNNATVEVENDFALAEPITILSGYGTDKTVTLDLKGHTIEGLSDNTALITSTVHLVVVDSVGGGQIVNYGTGGAYSGNVDYLNP